MEAIAVSTNDTIAQSARPSSQLLNHLVDNKANQDPDLLYAEVPLSTTSFDAGFRKITYRKFANAIDGFAWWILKAFGPGNSKTLSYIGPNDLRHNILLLGSIKAGYKMIFTSPRYSALAQVNLLSSIDCKTMLTPEIRPPVVDSILDCYSMRLLQIPTLDDLLEQTHPHFPFKKTFKKARNEPLVVLHTSGTTGLPKPIIWTHDWAASFAEQRTLVDPPGFELSDRQLLGNRILSLMPPFHAAHLFASLFFTIFCGSTTVYPLSVAPPSAQMILDCLEHTSIDALTLVPPQVEEIARNPKTLETISERVNTVFWAGGDISLAAGDSLSSKMRLFTTCGSTEMGMWPTLRRAGEWPAAHWKFMRIHPTAHVQFRHQSDDLYEAFVERNPDFEQPVFKIFPNTQDFSSGDLFSPHPSDLELWQYRGRSDDMLVFSSGEKYHPATMEARIKSHPEVKEAILVGVRRPQAALLLEMDDNVPIQTPELQAAGLSRLWPVIDQANQMCPSFAKVTRELVLFLDKEKPAARAAKGTVQRQQTLQLYEKELDALFNGAVVNGSA